MSGGSAGRRRWSRATTTAALEPTPVRGAPVAQGDRSGVTAGAGYPHQPRLSTGPQVGAAPTPRGRSDSPVMALDDFRPFSPDEAGELDFLLFRQDGVISTRQARRFLSAKAIRHRLASGRWRPAHRGIYLTETGPVTVHQRRWIAALAAGHGRIAPLAGLSALAVLGLRGHPDRPIRVLVRAERADSDPPPGVRVHRTRHLPPEDVHRAGQPPCTMPGRSVVDAAQWARTDDEAVIIIAAAVQQRLVGAVDIDAVLSRPWRIRRRAVIEAAAADATGGAHSGYEIDFARLRRRAGLPEPSRQSVRFDSTGRRRYRDVRFDEWGVHVEIDGGQHMEIRSWYADMRQQNELAIAGERLLRFPGFALRSRPDEVITQVRAALVAAGWRP